jgi:tRNA threonylcarbamoyladenosine biosynthesis protein TsaB
MTPADTGPSSSSVVVRALTPQDVGPVQSLIAQCPEAAQWSMQGLQALSTASDRAWVAECDRSNTICGFLSARIVSDQAEILNLAVSPECRRAGHATALLREAYSEFRRFNLSSIFLEVRESNPPAIRFYERCGFANNGVRPGYYRNPNEAAILMVKKFTD